MGAAIAELENRANQELPDRRMAPTPRLRVALAEWADAVWSAATKISPPSLNDAIRVHGLDIARHPVFVCGVHRSGTTLVRDLLDGHPSLTVLPSEGTFFTSLEAKLQALPADAAQAFMAREWLVRLANPINQPPFWLLGRTGAASPYVSFVRRLRGWWSAVEVSLGATAASWPLAALALAYASTGDDANLPPPLRRWVEKTPTNERFLDRIWKEFPQAKVIHVVREPRAVFASRLKLEAHLADSVGHARRILSDLDMSYRVAAARAASEPDERYRMVRYEDLVGNVQGVMTGLAGFLQIEPNPTLFTPTVAGLLSFSNSSFGVSDSAGEVVASGDHTAEVLTARDRDVLAAAVSESAAALGYPLETAGWWRSLSAKLARMVR